MSEKEGSTTSTTIVMRATEQPNAYWADFDRPLSDAELEAITRILATTYDPRVRVDFVAYQPERQRIIVALHPRVRVSWQDIRNILHQVINHCAVGKCFKVLESSQQAYGVQFNFTPPFWQKMKLQHRLQNLDAGATVRFSGQELWVRGSAIPSSPAILTVIRQTTSARQVPVDLPF